MKRITLLTFFVAALMMVTPALAGPQAPVGEQLNLYQSGDQMFPANTPFHIQHGWVQEPADHIIGLFGFKLEVDGIWVKEDYVERDVIVGEGGPLFDLLWVFNFPGGMTGTHTFRGHWYEACQVAREGSDGIECEHPNTLFEVRTTEVIVTFTP